MTSVVIVADSGDDMARLTSCVTALRGMAIVRHMSGRASLTRVVAGQAPSLVLIRELRSQRLTIERIAEVRSASPDTKVVVLAADSGARWLARALRAGAAAVLPGQIDARALGTVLEEVLLSDTSGAAPLAQMAPDTSRSRVTRSHSPTEGIPEMRVVIVVDNALTAEAIRREMRHAPACRVIGYVNPRGSCAIAVADAAPDLVVIDDASDPELTLSRIRQVRAVLPNAKVVLLTVRMEPSWLSAASAAGIDAAIAKSAAPASVGLLIREIAAGHVFHAFGQQPVRSRGEYEGPELTAREHEILSWVAAGASNGAIARELFVTEQTVKFHLSNIYRKLGVANRTEASHYAHVHGLLEPTPADAIPMRLGSIRAAA